MVNPWIHCQDEERDGPVTQQMMRDVVPLIDTMQEMSFIFDIDLPNPEVFCKVFKYNQSCIAVCWIKKIYSKIFIYVYGYVTLIW